MANFSKEAFQQRPLIKKVVVEAASNCFGVVGFSIAGPDDYAFLLSGENSARGVQVTFTKDMRPVINVNVVLEFGVNMKAVCQNLADAICYLVEKETSYKVKKINICVESVRV